MKTENDCRCDKRINQLEEALRNIANGGKLDEPTTPAPTPWEVKEGYWYEQYQLMRERYNRQIGKNTKQAERIVQLEAALDAMVEGVARSHQ